MMMVMMYKEPTLKTYLIKNYKKYTRVKFLENFCNYGSCPKHLTFPKTISRLGALKPFHTCLTQAYFLRHKQI